MSNNNYTQEKSKSTPDVQEAGAPFTHERKKFATQMDARICTI